MRRIDINFNILVELSDIIERKDRRKMLVMFSFFSVVFFLILKLAFWLSKDAPISRQKKIECHFTPTKTL